MSTCNKLCEYNNIKYPKQLVVHCENPECLWEGSLSVCSIIWTQENPETPIYRTIICPKCESESIVF